MPYFVFLDTNAVLVRKNRWTFKVYKKAFPSGGRGTAIAVDEVFLRAETPHPSALRLPPSPTGEGSFYLP